MAADVEKSPVVAPFAIQHGEGPSMASPTGASVTVMARTGDTGGALTVLEIVSPPRDGPALHTHTLEDELWFVLEGDYRFKAGDRVFRASTGGMAFGPRGIPHAFQNVGAGPGRLLVVSTPSGLERFFEEYAALLPGPVDPAAFAAVGHATGIEFVGPPLAVSDPL
ncbi:MAG TPA: cupin domain-containing protein [Pseudonocardia sp.]|nr:cupin domain-containing protein [Pseudonocardia sp.]